MYGVYSKYYVDAAIEYVIFYYYISSIDIV